MEQIAGGESTLMKQMGTDRTDLLDLPQSVVSVSFTSNLLHINLDLR